MAHCEYPAFKKWFFAKIVNAKSNVSGIEDKVRTDMLKAWNAGYAHALQQSDPLKQIVDSKESIAAELASLSARLKALKD